MFRKVFEAEEGFTLVELLVTIAILAVLFGIVTLTLTGVGSGAEDSVKVAECAVVQSAIDIYMANYNEASLAGRAALDSAVIDTGDADVEFDEYLRDLPTKYEYSWSTAGLVSCDSIP